MKTARVKTPKRIDEVVFVAVFTLNRGTPLIWSVSTDEEGCEKKIDGSPIARRHFRIARCRLVETKPKKRSKP